MKWQGLTEQEVVQQRQEYGENIIVEAEPETFADKVKGALEDPMIRLLMAIAGIMSIMVLMGHGDWTEIIGIVLSVVIVTLISAKTEMASDSEYRRLKNETEKDKVKVYRDGHIKELIVDELVVHDIVLLQSGDKIPADGYLVDGKIQVDNASLNGESEPCKKSAHAEAQTLSADKWASVTSGDVLVDAHSLFKGAVTVDGTGLMKVMAVGMKTMMGEMADEMSESEVDSPLKVKLSALAHKISVFGYVGAAVIFMALMIHYVAKVGGTSVYFAQDPMNIIKDVLEVLMMAVVIIVMAVPEGLPLMIAIVLMQNTSKLLNNHVLVKKPVGIETAGSLNILFSDKTGTITKGQLEVVTYFDATTKEHNDLTQAFELDMTACIAANTDALFEDEHTILGGNATDKALLSYIGLPRAKRVEGVKVVAKQPFNSTNKYSAAQLEQYTYYKGAPERLMTQATHYKDEFGDICPLTADMIDTISAKIDELAARSMRVLAFATSPTPLVENQIATDLVLVGFVGIRDDVRPEARQAIADVQEAGVQVVMITGDRKETAVAIATDCGLIASTSHIALTSDELSALSDEEVMAQLPNIRVIARALPSDKSRMVRLAQQLNLVCGMTGDGVNDAPALKRADVGFAMGSGTDVAKEVGDIVILDDNFKSIEHAILYGRTIYHNIQKFIKFQLTINVAAVAVSAIAPFLGIEQPLSITHILWINLIMDGLGALALGAEPALATYMKEKPKTRTENIVSRPMMTQILIAGIYVTLLSFVFLLTPSIKAMFSAEQHLTAYFSLFVLTAVANGLNIRSEGANLFEHLDENKGFIKVMGLVVVVQIILTYVGGEWFSCTPLEPTQWAVVFAFAVTIIPMDLIRKGVMRLICKN